MDGNVRWWRLLCLLMWFGQCLSMQPGLEYHYRYKGFLATGITEMRSQYAATGIKMEVTVQVEEDYSFLIQFYDIQVGEYHDTQNCHFFTSELPLTYSELQNGEEFLQRPFRIAMDVAQNTGILEVATDEPLWITNVKKAVIDVFPLAALWRELQLGRGERFLRSQFGSEEELIGGRCMTWFSATKLPEDETLRVEKKRLARMEEDIQRAALTADRLTSAKGPSAGAKGPGAGAKGPAAGAKGPGAGAKGPAAAGGKGQKTSAPVAEYTASVAPINDSLWKVTRTVDYDMCEEQLVTLKLNAPADTSKLIGRSSVAIYLLRGDQRGIRVEKGHIDGSVSLFTSSDKDDRIDTFTNQTVELIAVRRITRKISISYQVKRFRHWYFEFDHLTKRRTDGEHLTVEETLTGIKITGNKFPALKKTILNVLTEIYHNPKHLADVRRDLSETITYLSYSNIKEIYEQFEETIVGGSEEDQVEAKYCLYNFHLGLAISGSEPAFNYLLDRLSEDDLNEKIILTEFPYVDVIASLYEIGLKTIKDPRLVRRMVEFAIAMNWDAYGSVNKAIALTSAASLAQKLCFDPERRRTSSLGTCRPQYVCESEAVANAFLVYLQERIQESSNNVTTRVVYIQTLTNLGLPRALDILGPIIMGSSETDVGVRKIAIMALSSHIMHQSTISTVFNLLTPIIENRGEHPDIRNIAFLALASWKPSLTWWRHMAYFTWYETNSQVSNFVSSAIHNFAEKNHHLSEMASRVVHLAKSPIVSYTHSYIMYKYFPSYSKDFGTHNELLWFASADGLLPTQVTLRIISKALYGFPTVVKYLVHQNGLSKFFMLFLEKLISKPSPGVQDQSIVEDMIREAREQIGYQGDQSNLWQFWDTLDDLLHTRGYAGHIENVAEDLLARVDTGEYTSHDIWVDSTVAFPTDLGLPIIIKHTEDSTLLEGLSEREVADGELGNYKTVSGIDIQTGYSQSTSIRVKTLVPWSGTHTAVGAGIHSFSDVLLPLTVYFGWKTHPGSHGTSVVEAVCKVQTSLEESDAIIQGQNCPYTVMYATFPTERVAEDNEYKAVNRRDTEVFNSKGEYLSGSGFHLEYTWESPEMFLPQGADLLFSIFEIVPLHKTWNYQLVFDPTKSTASGIKFFFEIAKFDWPSDFSDDLTQFSQQSQGQEDFADLSQFSQFSQSNSQDYDDFSQQSQGADLQEHPDEDKLIFADLSILSQLTSLRDKLNSHGEFGKIYGIGFAVSQDGSESTDYIAELYVSRGIDLHDYKNINLFMAKMGTKGRREPMLFSSWIFQEPLFIPFITLEELLKTDLKLEIEGEVKLALPGIESKAHLKAVHEVTDEWREQLTLTCVPEGSESALEFMIMEVFDHNTLKISWDEFLHLNFNLSNIISSNFKIANTAAEDGHEIEIDTKRDMMNGISTVQVESPSTFPVVTIGTEPPLLFPGLLSFDAFVYELINGRRSSYCTIKDSGVKTFDTVAFPAIPNNCWKIAAYDCYSGKAMFQVRKTDQWEARVLWKDEGLVFDITNSDIMVNGDSPDDRDERYKVVRSDGALMVIFKTGAVIRVSDKVEINAPPEIRSFPCGLCGNFDGEKSSEMIGPTGCVYTDPELFGHAWSVSGDGCNAFSLRGNKQKVERYQQNCLKKNFVPTGVAHSDSQRQCTNWHFVNRVEGTWNCTSIIRIPKCKKGCVAHYLSPEPIPFDCYATDGQHADEGVKCRSRTLNSPVPKGCRKQ